MEPLRLREAGDRAGVCVSVGHSNDGLELRPNLGRVGFGREDLKPRGIEPNPSPRP